MSKVTPPSLGEAQIVQSKDGTQIAFYTVGSGPSVLVLPGALTIAQDYATFANKLATTHTVHVIERRGRGLSGPQGEDYSITKECEDVAAVQAETDAHLIVGHSFGGLVALEFARSNASIQKLVVYEAGVSIEGSIPISWADEYSKKLGQNKPADAFIVFIKAMDPRARINPSWLLRILLPMIMGKKATEKTHRLLPSNLLEHKEVARLDGSYQNYSQISASTLIMYGGKSPKITEKTLRQLATVVPSVTVTTYPKLDHFGLDKGAPAQVANDIRTFFG
jgi:pimeloyl-ACP methyl ester carboxylesterase